MVLNPEVQKRAQAEIDHVVGSDRLPNFDDRVFMPYIEAVLRETLRFHPIIPLSKVLVAKFIIPLTNLPLGIPHAAVNNDVYEGYFIPKGEQMTEVTISSLTCSQSGTTIVTNIWYNKFSNAYSYLTTTMFPGQ